jgi:hypothetical protein
LRHFNFTLYLQESEQWNLQIVNVKKDERKEEDKEILCFFTENISYVNEAEGKCQLVRQIFITQYYYWQLTNTHVMKF